MTGEIARTVDDSQEGFAKGRNGLNNVTMIDAKSRAVDHRISRAAPLTIEEYGLLLLFDFKAAFPSLAHKFILLVLEVGGAPLGILLYFPWSFGECLGAVL